MRYKVIGDHPILRRPDRFNLTYKEAENYAAKLRKAGYENVRIQDDLRTGGNEE